MRNETKTINLTSVIGAAICVTSQLSVSAHFPVLTNSFIELSVLLCIESNVWIKHEPINVTSLKIMYFYNCTCSALSFYLLIYSSFKKINVALFSSFLIRLYPLCEKQHPMFHPASSSVVVPCMTI